MKDERWKMEIKRFFLKEESFLKGEEQVKYLSLSFKAISVCSKWNQMEHKTNLTFKNWITI